MGLGDMSNEELRASMIRLRDALHKHNNPEEDSIMAKFIANVVVAGAAFALGYFVMVEGWGLTVLSWPWVIGGWAGMVALAAVQKAVNE